MELLERLRDRIACVQAAKERERCERIDRLVEAAGLRGEDPDRIFWSIVHDLECAPATTNRRQLEEIGFTLDSLEDLTTLSDGQVHDRVWELINALAMIRVYLCRADHLCNRELLEELHGRVLDEPVPDLPHATGMRDWIDLSGRKGGAHGRHERNLPRP